MAAVECNLKSFLVKLRKMRAVRVRGPQPGRCCPRAETKWTDRSSRTDNDARSD